MLIGPKTLDFYPRTLVIPHKGQKEAGPLFPGILKPTDIDGNITVSLPHVSGYITKDLMGGRNVLTWEVVT